MTGSLRGPGPIHGLWSTTSHPAIIEAAATLHPDFIVADVQHGTHISHLGPALFTTMAHYGTPGLVRVAANDPTDIGRALDVGAAGVMIPMIDTAEDAHRAVAACHHAPRGTRSFGMQTPRVDVFADDYRPLCAVQIETATAVGNVADIAAVDGVDWLYVGPADLGLSVGGIAAPDIISVFDGTHPLASEMLAAFEAVVDAARSQNKLAGIHAGSGPAAVVAEEHGFRVAAVAADLGESKSGMAAQLRIARAG